MLTCSEWDGDMSPLPKGADTRVLTSCTDVTVDVASVPFCVTGKRMGLYSDLSADSGH